MSETNGSQTIACNVSSCQHFKNSLCELSSIEVGACNNVSSGMSEDETLCSSYVKREDDVSNIKSMGMAYTTEYDGLL